MRLHAVSVPVSPLAVSVIRNVQVPAAFLPSKAVSTCSGRNDPVNGGVPAVIEIAASSSKTVLMKLSPPPPRLSTSRTVVASGPISRISTSPV